MVKATTGEAATVEMMPIEVMTIEVMTVEVMTVEVTVEPRAAAVEPTVKAAAIMQPAAGATARRGERCCRKDNRDPDECDRCNPSHDLFVSDY
jgi:hypothetical protein